MPVTDERDLLEGLNDEQRESWRQILEVGRKYIALCRRQAADLRGAATFRPREAARYQREALRLERMADVAEKSLDE